MREGMRESVLAPRYKKIPIVSLYIEELGGFGVRQGPVVQSSVWEYNTEQRDVFCDE